MSFLIDKGLEAAKRISNAGRHERTPEESAREFKYADSAKKYKKLVLKWLYEDKIPIETLKRHKLWKPELLNVQVSSMGGGTGIPGVPLIPVLAPVSSRPVETVTEEKVNEIDDVATRAAAMEEEVQRQRARAERQHESERATQQFWDEIYAASAEFQHLNDPGNYEGGPQGQPPTLIQTPEGATGAYNDPSGSSSGSSSSSSSVNSSSLQAAPPAVLLTPEGKVAPRSRKFRAMPDKVSSAAGRAAKAAMLRAKQTPMKANVIRNAIVSALGESTGSVQRPAGMTQTALNRQISAAWTLASQDQRDAIVSILENAGVLESEDDDAMTIARRIKDRGQSSRDPLLSILRQLKLESVYLVGAPQSGPGYEEEKKQSPEEDPLEFIVQNRDMLVGRLEQAGVPEAAIESVLEAVTVIAQDYVSTAMDSGAEADKARAKRQAVSNMKIQIRKILEAQEFRSNVPEMNPTHLAQLATDIFAEAPGFLQMAPPTENRRFSPTGVMGAASRMYEGAREVGRNIMGGLASVEQFLGNGDALDRANELVRRVGASVTFDRRGIAQVRADEAAINAFTRYIMSTRPRADVAVRVGSGANRLLIYREPATGSVSRTSADHPLAIDYEGDFPGEGDELDEKHSDPPHGGGGPPGGGPPGGGPGRGGGGGGPPGPPGGGPNRNPWIFNYRGREWKLKSILSVVAGLISIGAGTATIVKAITDAKEGRVASMPITPDEKEKPSIEPDDTSMPTSADRTYEPGIDGKPKLFPGYGSGGSKDTAYTAPEEIPVGKNVSKYKLTMPELAPPSAKFTMRDYAMGVNTDDETIRELMDDRPELAEMIEQYNVDATNYNLAQEKGDSKGAQALYNKLRLAHAEIGNAARTPLDREGTSAYPIETMPLEYPGNDTFGQRIQLKHIRTKTNRTTTLGLDDEIESFNEAAMKLNKLASDGATATPEYKAALAEYEKERMKIDRVESSPELASGTVRPKLIEEKYPKRIQELVNAALENKPLKLSDSDVALLERYPAAGRPVLEYSEYIKKYPEELTPVGGEVGKEELGDRLRLGQPIDTKLKALRDSGYKLKASERPFAGGQHEYPVAVQKIIDRIAGHDSREALVFSQRERQALSEYPELEEKVGKYESDFLTAQQKYPLGASGTREYSLRRGQRAKETRSSRQALSSIKANNYRGGEPISMSVSEVESNIAKDSNELRSTSKMLKDALAGRAPRAYIEELYRRQNTLRSRLAAEHADVAGRGTYLADVNRENLPGDNTELKTFQRLQNVEREFQGHQDALFEYNDQERRLVYAGMSKQEMYEERLKLLQGIAARQGLTDVYDDAVARDVEVLDEDADTVVNLPDDPDAAKDQGPQNGEGSSRAEVVDPDERALFLRSRQEEAQEFRNWENFSYVAPGFGLGGPKYNTLQRANELTERRRFRNVRMPPARQQVKYPARPIEMRGYEAKQPMMIPIYQGDFGEVHYEDAYHNDYQQGRRVLWTNPYQDTTDRDTYLSPSNIYQPDYAGYEFAQRVNTAQGRHMVPIGETSKPHEYWGTNLRFHETNGPDPRLQNRANNFPVNGEPTMITTERSGRRDLAPRERDTASALRAGLYSSRH